MQPAGNRDASYKASVAWLFGTQLFGIKLGLDNIHRLLAALDLPAASHRIIHVAGTNGKGSVCAMIESIARAQGYRTGLFTSPHLVSFRERIQVDGEQISKDAVVRGLNELRNVIAGWDPHPTFFEITTALALQDFRRANCDVVVLETGMGGRLDATNAIIPVVSVITPIALDHQKWLGNSLAEIAAEKAGIIKPRIPVVSARQDPVAEGVLREKAAACKAPIEFVEQGAATRWVNLAGAHQQENAALAIAALRSSGITIDKNFVDAGLAKVTWPARFHRWDNRIVIDGAHNPAGAASLVETWRETFGDTRASVILATLRDKDTAGIVSALLPITARVFLPEARAERALPPDQQADVVRSAASSSSLYVSIQRNLATALEEALRCESPILITGSLHFAGEALALLGGDPSELEACLQ
ncbi:MAG: bifunctional folylpolyglutamate synthase/dihydrofolate synthase [Chthoniobacterales bacterium]|nr:bifunctional folylpolyglutamate synthase/dihydrofolate synthase [Chthoniobacterales bacterium]